MTEAAAPFLNSAGTNVDVLIVGAGFSGLCMGIKILEAGMESFLIIEKSGDIGDTWWDNRYPGCACDIPSHLYSFSFAPSTEWTRMYPGQQEIHDYLKRCVPAWARCASRAIRSGMVPNAFPDRRFIPPPGITTLISPEKMSPLLAPAQAPSGSYRR